MGIQTTHPVCCSLEHPLINAGLLGLGTRVPTECTRRPLPAGLHVLCTGRAIHLRWYHALRYFLLFAKMASADPISGVLGRASQEASCKNTPNIRLSSTCRRPKHCNVEVPAKVTRRKVDLVQVHEKVLALEKCLAPKSG